MTLLTTFAIAGALFIMVLTPGIGVFAVIGRALASGFRPTSVFVMGIVLGDVVYLLLTVYGLAAIASVMGDFFTIIQYLGGAYLIWLGIKLWRVKVQETEIQKVTENSWQSSFLSGFFLTLSNPKVIFFYAGLLPTFINIKTIETSDVLTLCIVVTTVPTTVLFGYAYCASKARHLLKSDTAKRKMNCTAGTMMIAAGTALIAR